MSSQMEVKEDVGQPAKAEPVTVGYMTFKSANEALSYYARVAQEYPQVRCSQRQQPTSSLGASLRRWKLLQPTRGCGGHDSCRTWT